MSKKKKEKAPAPAPNEDQLKEHINNMLAEHGYKLTCNAKHFRITAPFLEEPREFTIGPDNAANLVVADEVCQELLEIAEQQDSEA